ncbi:MAG: MBL fold metallo-hydrolase [Tepidiformaceae bacterium]
MPELELTFLGTGNAFAPGGLCWNGFVANRTHLFEAPPTALPSLHNAGLDPNDLETVVISHHHGDHFLGLPFLMLHWKERGRTKPLRIVGPPGTESLAREIAARVYPSLFEFNYPLEWVALNAGESASSAGLELETVEMKHDTRLALNLGFRASLAGRSFSYTGDSAICDAVLDLARGVDVMVAECASRERTAPTHMDLVDDIPIVRAVMRPDARLILTHLGPGITAGDLPNTTVAQDLAVYRL